MGTDSTNPVFKELLDVIPDSLHGLVTPVLEKWDSHAESRIQETKDAYKDYDWLVTEGIDPNFVNQALMLAHNINENPAAVMGQINDAYGVGFISKEQYETALAEAANVDPDDLGLEDHNVSKINLADDPQYKALQETVAAMQKREDDRLAALEVEESTSAHEKLLDDLQEANKDKGGINRTLVTAFMTQGMSAEDAVKAYQEMVAEQLATGGYVQQQNNQQTTQQTTQQNGQSATDQTLAYLNGSGEAGAPIEPVDFGKMGKSGLKDLTTAYLKAHADDQ